MSGGNTEAAAEYLNQLRDRFAGQIAAGLLVRELAHDPAGHAFLPTATLGVCEYVADAAYVMAEALVERRER